MCIYIGIHMCVFTLVLTINMNEWNEKNEGDMDA